MERKSTLLSKPTNSSLSRSGEGRGCHIHVYAQFKTQGRGHGWWMRTAGWCVPSTTTHLHDGKQGAAATEKHHICNSLLQFLSLNARSLYRIERRGKETETLLLESQTPSLLECL